MKERPILFSAPMVRAMLEAAPSAASVKSDYFRDAAKMVEGGAA